MEIYKLRDFERESVQDKTTNAGLRITAIKQAVKNENRVNVFVNSKYSFSLDIAQLVDLKIKVGQVISEEELSEFKKASEFGKLYQRTLEWVLTRPHSIQETRDYLRRKIRSSSSEALRAARPSLTPSKETSDFSPKYSPEFLGVIIERLVSKGYLDDFKFAEYYVENRFVKKGISKKRLKMELMKKGVASEIISEVLDNSNRNDEEEILKIIAKKRARYDDEKLIQYLCRQGFSYELVLNLVRSYGTDSRNLE